MKWSRCRIALRTARNEKSWRSGAGSRKHNVGGPAAILKRRHGIGRCRYRGLEGMKRWVGLGALADNLINIGNTLAFQNTSFCDAK